MGEGAGPGLRPAGDEWADRYALLHARDVVTLTVDELELLAEASFWMGHPLETIAARQRAYRLRRDAGDDDRAARAAWQLFHNHFELDETSAASGWLARAGRHVARDPQCPERGYVLIAESMWSAFQGELDRSVQLAAEAAQLGETAGDRDLAAWGLALQGGMQVANGDVADGVVRLDDAMLEVTSGELSRFVTGWIYCFLLKTCHALGDVARAVEWTDSAVRWCARSGVNSWYPGVCRLHRCEVASLRGEWDEAEREALRAAEELRPFGAYLVAHGQYIAGEIRLYRGQFSGAEEAFRSAHQLGSDPQPGFALLRLAQGDPEGAVIQLRRAVSDGWQPPLPRARVLAAHVRTELEVGDVDAAKRSLEELRELADRHHGTLVGAIADMAEAAVAMSVGEVDEALPRLRAALGACRDLECRYDGARARLLLGEAYLLLDDAQSALMEFQAARDEFASLGADPDRRRAELLGGPVASDLPMGISERELEVLRLVAGGLTNKQVAAELVISEHTVRRHLANTYRKIGVTSRAGATAFVFEHDLG